MLPVRTQPPLVPEQAVPPVRVKVVEVERPWAFVTVAVMEGMLSAGTQAGGAHVSSLRVALFVALPSVPVEAVQEKERALPSGSLAVTRKATVPLAGTVRAD